MTIWAAKSDEQARTVIRRMLGHQEWFVVAWQAVVCAGSLAIDNYRDGWPQLVIIVVTAAHLAAIPAFARYGGPFSHGGVWIYVALAWVLLLPCAMLLLIDFRADSTRLAGIPIGNFAVSTLTVFAFFPWWSGRKTRWVRIGELLYVSLAVLLPGVVIALVAEPGAYSYLSALIVSTPNLVGYILGRTIRQLCEVAIQQQVEVQQQSYDEFFNFLHSHVKAGIAAVRAEWGNSAAMREKLEELEQAVSDRRIDFLLSGERVPLAALLSERIRTFAGTLTLAETPRVAALTVPKSAGVLISRALGDLLKNAMLHGGQVVSISAHTEGDQLRLEIKDDGPGFDPALLEDETLSVARLRCAAKGLGGDLVATPTGQGSTLRLTVPLDPPAAEERPRHARTAR